MPSGMVLVLLLLSSSFPGRLLLAVVVLLGAGAGSDDGSMIATCSCGVLLLFWLPTNSQPSSRNFVLLLCVRLMKRVNAELDDVAYVRRTEIFWISGKLHYGTVLMYRYVYLPYELLLADGG